MLMWPAGTSRFHNEGVSKLCLSHSCCNMAWIRSCHLWRCNLGLAGLIRAWFISLICWAMSRLPWEPVNKLAGFRLRNECEDSQLGGDLLCFPFSCVCWTLIVLEKCDRSGSNQVCICVYTELYIELLYRICVYTEKYRSCGRNVDFYDLKLETAGTVWK